MNEFVLAVLAFLFMIGAVLLGLRMAKRSAKGSEQRQESDDYPALNTLIRAYFNQDWEIIEETEDPDEVIAVWVKAEGSPERIQSLIRDIERFLAKYGQNDTELTGALERIFKPDSAFYNMKDRGTREGLEKVIEILSNPPKTS